MKRSRINTIIRDAETFIEKQGFALPPFAAWTPEQWRARATPALIDARLGWDVTDFGRDTFEHLGLVLVTLRNGQTDSPRPYAEKIIVVRDGQHCPMHRHFRKVEDIINRGAGTLVLALHAAGDQGAVDRTAEVVIETDGCVRTLAAGQPLRLRPGESVTLHPHHWHGFWAEGDVLVGEVSTVNDDATDNWFEEPLGRFAAIEEDEPPYRLLVADYPA
ncbi:MAG: D-lyxose/D-mannose family sugar isomerase [Pseudomonadota bacterium]